MHETILAQALAFLALTLVGFNVAGNIAHHLFGGSRTGVASLIAQAMVLGSIPVTMYVLTGMGNWAIVPAFVVAMAIAKVCAWLELHDEWSKKREPSTLTVKRWVAGLTITTFITGLLAANLPAPLAYYSIAVPFTFGLSAAMIALTGWDEHRKREARRQRNAMKPIKL